VSVENTMKSKEEKRTDLIIWIIKAAMIITAIVMFVLTFVAHPIPN
tara:strand:- start:140 stop:277 length:138 start_codon:yes stop_codon:yes gene_type:complete